MTKPKSSYRYKDPENGRIEVEHFEDGSRHIGMERRIVGADPMFRYWLSRMELDEVIAQWQEVNGRLV